MEIKEAIQNVKKWLACINRDDSDCLRVCDSCQNHVKTATFYESLTVIVADAEKKTDEDKQLTKWLKELQERRKQSKWTLISEEYPQIGQRVLVTLVDGTMDIRRCKLAEYFDCYYGDVIAWMPAPEPQGRSGKENRWQMNKKNDCIKNRR